MLQELWRSVVKRITGLILAEQANTAEKNPLSSSDMPLARRGWINKCHFGVCKLLFHNISSEQNNQKQIPLVRSLVFSLLGRLERGDEAMAAIILSQDVLFDPSASTSQVSTLFMGELCGSHRLRKQLDHSFKLQHGLGLTAEEFGAFALDSLLSEADQQGANSKTDPPLLPIGKMWLWQALSGSIRMRDQPVDTGTQEAANVVSSVLRLILELEQDETIYAKGIPLGAKIYYLMNICLHNESVLRQDGILDVADKVLRMYWTHVDQEAIVDLVSACHEHTDPSKERVENLKDEEQKLLQLLEPETDRTKAFQAFLDDLTEVFLDYGAQYEFFAKCLRIFLQPVFPARTRVRILKEWQGVLHLFTLPGEMEDPKSLEQLVRTGIAGSGVTSRDQAILLDRLVSLLQSGGTPRPLDGYMRLYAVSLLSKNLAMSLRDGSQGFEKRLKPLEGQDACAMIFHCASDLLKGGMTEEEMVQAFISIAKHRNKDNSEPASIEQGIQQLEKLAQVEKG